MPQKSLIYNSTNSFFKDKEKKPVSHPQILPTMSPRQVPYRKLFLSKKLIDFRITYARTNLQFG